jgi:bestrophin, other
VPLINFIPFSTNFRWRGSIYKLVWLDLTSFLFVYYALNLTYRLVLNEDQKTTFEAIVKYCDEHSQLIPLSFVLGFYVSIVMTRWWNQYTVSCPLITVDYCL